MLNDKCSLGIYLRLQGCELSDVNQRQGTQVVGLSMNVLIQLAFRVDIASFSSRLKIAFGLLSSIGKGGCCYKSENRLQ